MPHEICTLDPPTALPEGARYLVMDIETILDPRFPARFKPDGTEQFPSTPEWQVVAVLGLAVDAEGRFQRSYLFGGHPLTEERKLLGLARIMHSHPEVSLVSWNGRRFDMPVVATRLMMYGWPSPHYSHKFGHRYRFASVGDTSNHLDLMDQLADFGSGQNASLDNYARMIGLPGKVFGEGNAVAQLVAAGRMDDVERYCMTDVIQTAFLLGRFLVLTGTLTRKRHREVMRANLDDVMDIFGPDVSIDRKLLLLDPEA